MKMRPNRRRRRLILWSLGMGRMAAFIRSRLAAARLGHPADEPVGAAHGLRQGEDEEATLRPVGWGGSGWGWTDQLGASRYFARVRRRVADSATGA